MVQPASSCGVTKKPDRFFGHTSYYEVVGTFDLNDDPLPLNEQEHGDFLVWNRAGDRLGLAHTNQPVIQAVPEPGTFVLLTSGLLWLGFSLWRKRARI